MKADETSIPEKDIPEDAENLASETQEDATEADPIEALKEELRRKEDELAEEKANYLRLKAETDNYRKRLIREKEEFSQYANERLIKNILPIYENLGRALAAPETTVDKLKEGVDMILKQFASFLEKEKVESIDSLGNPFDPSIHEAVCQLESSDHEESTVIQEYSKGYNLNGRILQPAKVVISKLPAPAASEESSESSSEDEDTENAN